MATAISSWPIFDVAEMGEAAANLAGVDFRSGYDLRSVRRSLELLSIEWANRGLNLWTVEGPITVNLQPGLEHYSLPTDTVDMVDHILRVPQVVGATAQSDIPLERWTFSEYSSIPNKLATGRPSLISIRRLINPYFVVWMVPPVSSTYQVIYWRMRRLKSVGVGGTGIPEIPWRFIPAMTTGLAFYLALKSKDPIALERVQMLKAQYNEQFNLAADEDRDRATVRFVPGGYDF